MGMLELIPHRLPRRTRVTPAFRYIIEQRLHVGCVLRLKDLHLILYAEQGGRLQPDVAPILGGQQGTLFDGHVVPVL